jgi:transposase
MATLADGDYYLRAWRLDGTWERLHTVLRERLRVRLGRDAQPSAGSIDSQSVKTRGVAGARGYDACKQVKGRKRHLLVDTEGFVLSVAVHPANIMDRDGVKLLLTADIRSRFPRLRHVWLDAGYQRQREGQGVDRTDAGVDGAAPPRSGSSMTCPMTRSIGPNTSRRPAFGCCQDGGSWSGRLRGSRRTAG